MERIPEDYALPSRDYLRTELAALEQEFRAFEQSIAGGLECSCVDNAPPPDPADNGCDCDPCNCPTDRFPCHGGSEFNNGDRSNAGLRAALERLRRQADAMQAELNAGGGCGCAGRAREGKPLDRLPKQQPQEQTQDTPQGAAQGTAQEKAQKEAQEKAQKLAQELAQEVTGEIESEGDTEGDTEGGTEDEQSGYDTTEGGDTEGDSEGATVGVQSGYDTTTDNIVLLTPRGGTRPLKRPRDTDSEPDDSTLGPFRDEFSPTQGLNFS